LSSLPIPQLTDSATNAVKSILIVLIVPPGNGSRPMFVNFRVKLNGSSLTISLSVINFRNRRSISFLWYSTSNLYGGKMRCLLRLNPIVRPGLSLQTSENLRTSGHAPSRFLFVTLIAPLLLREPLPPIR